MTLINFLAASKLQAAIECLPRTCEDDHRDRYSAGQGEIEMNATELETVMKNQVIEYLREIVKGHGLHQDTVSRVLALIVTDLCHDPDKDMHIKGQQFGVDYQECMCRRVNHSSEQA